MFHAVRLRAGVSVAGDGLENHTNWCIMLQTTARENTSRTCQLAGHDDSHDYCGQLDGAATIGGEGKTFPRHVQRTT